MPVLAAPRRLKNASRARLFAGQPGSCYETGTGTILTRWKLALHVGRRGGQQDPQRPNGARIDRALLPTGGELRRDPADPESAPAFGIEDQGGRFAARRDTELAEGR